MIIRSKANGISVKFYISLRRGMIKALKKLSINFDLIIYTSLEKAIGDVILDFLEDNLCGGKPLFTQRLHSQDCDLMTSEELNLSNLKVRSMSVIL
jgi:TFIIF-interacting CTD phosphatase-like protein